LTVHLRKIPGIVSRYLESRHELIVFEPPGYRRGDSRRYPVLYLQDGQNLFDPHTAFLGQEWDAEVAAERVIEQGTVEPLLIVGIYNAGVHRIDEYTPSYDPGMGRGGKAHLYGRMLVEEIIPWVHDNYDTASGPENTGVGGSSLGALLALYLGLQHSDVFGKVAALSPSVWWGNRWILRFAATHPLSLIPRMWLDVGTAEGPDPEATLADTRRLRSILEKRGWQEGHTLRYLEAEGAPHNEYAWGTRFGPMLEFLFPSHREIKPA
jgi:predicted alpha/beta superfamily hydrolase